MGRFIVKIGKKSHPSLVIKRAAELIIEGKLIVYPTDTVYGLGCDPLNIDAVKKVFEIKGRSAEKGLPILVADIEEAMKIAIFPNIAKKLADKFWPGNLTLVLPLRTRNLDAELSDSELPEPVYLDKVVTGGRDTVAVRVPSNNIVLGICRELKKKGRFGGIIGTSANYSGEPPPTDGQAAAEMFMEGVDLIIDGGKCRDRIPSTIVLVNNEDRDAGVPLDILREGAISKKDILEILGINGGLSNE